LKEAARRRLTYVALSDIEINKLFLKKIENFPKRVMVTLEQRIPRSILEK
jgi:hypothetical protein